MTSNNLKDLLDFICNSYDEFTIGQAKHLVERIYKNYVIEEDDKLHNRFFFEICPLLFIGQQLGSDETKLSFRVQGERVDGLIRHPSMNEPQKIEITAAIDGHQEALRMELRRKCGIAPAYQQIDAKGTKNNRIFGNNMSQALSSEELNLITSSSLRGALDKKIAKSQKNPHYRGAWLGIVFNDRNEAVLDRKKRRFDPICIDLIEELDPHERVFSRIFFVGTSRDYIFDSNSVLPSCL